MSAPDSHVKNEDETATPDRCIYCGTTLHSPAVLCPACDRHQKPIWNFIRNVPTILAAAPIVASAVFYLATNALDYRREHYGDLSVSVASAHSQYAVAIRNTGERDILVRFVKFEPLDFDENRFVNFHMVANPEGLVVGAAGSFPPVGTVVVAGSTKERARITESFKVSRNGKLSLEGTKYEFLYYDNQNPELATLREFADGHGGVMAFPAKGTVVFSSAKDDRLRTHQFPCTALLVHSTWRGAGLELQSAGNSPW